MTFRHRLLPTLVTALLPAFASAAQRPELVALAARVDPAPAPASAAAGRQDDGAETVTRTVALGPNGSLDIFNLAGGIVITGVPGEKVVVKAVKHVKGPASGAGAQMEATVIDVKEMPGRVEVRTSSRYGKHTRTWVEYSVQVPYGTSITARVLAGDIKVEKVKGDVQIESTTGTVEAIGTPRLVRAKALSGDILLSDAASAGALEASTVSGGLIVKGLKARTLELATISGDMTLQNVACERATVRTMNGDLDFLGPLVKGGHYEFTSHSGDVRLELGGAAGFELAAKTFSGDVRTDLPLEIAAQDPGLPPGVPQTREMRGTYGGGGAVVLVKTFSGSVVVSRAGVQAPAQKKRRPEN